MLTKRTRIVVRCFVIGVILGLLGFLAVYQSDTPDAQGVAAAKPPPRPNIVVVMIDDARVDDLAAMPKTKRLLSTRYVNFYDSLPLCCPARAAFLTGQYAHNNGIWDNTGDHGGWEPFKKSGKERHALPTWLQRTYKTTMIGKYLNGYRVKHGRQRFVPAGWDRWAAMSGQWMRYRHFALTVGSSSPDHAGTGHVINPPGYLTNVLTRRAKNALRTDLPKREPVFMWLSHLAPHVNTAKAVTPAPKYKGTSDVGVPSSPAFNERFVGDKPNWIRDLPRLTADGKQAIVKLRRERRESLRSVDDGVAQIVKVLRRHHELSNTVIMLVSDNGFMLGEHRDPFGKVVPYQESARVPLLARGPGFDPGKVGRVTVNVDLARTIANIARVKPSLRLDGTDLRRGAGVKGPRAILLEAPEDAGAGLPYAGVRTGKWIAVDWTGDGRELYNLAADPWQQRSVVGSHPKIADSLFAKMRRLKTCDGRECVTGWRP